MSQLRSFANYTNTAPVSPFAFSCNLANIDGYAAGAGWLQLHDKLVGNLLPGDVPLKSIRVSAAGPLPSYLPSLGSVLFLNALTVAFSSTENTYTAVGTSFDIWGEVDEFAGMETVIAQQNIQNVSNAACTDVVGWLEGNGPQSLYYATITNGGATTLYAMLFAEDIITNGDKPITEWPILAGATLNLNFGPTGLSPMSKIGNTLRQGCHIGMSTTPTIYTLPGVGESTIAIYYKA